MDAERIFVAQTPEELEDQAINQWAPGHRLSIVRLDDRVEESRDDSDVFASRQSVIQLDEKLTLPFYYRGALVKEGEG